VEFVIGAPDYPPMEDALVAAMRSRGHTDDGTYHSLKWLRENGVLAPRRDGRVPLSTESLAKREQGQEIRDGRGAVLWAPRLVVPTELARWESRLIDASRGGTPTSEGLAKRLSRSAQRYLRQESARDQWREKVRQMMEQNPKRPPKPVRELFKN